MIYDEFRASEAGNRTDKEAPATEAARPPTYVDLSEARMVLAELGIQLTERQMKRAAETDAEGRRKLPFFIDPIDGRLKIARQALIDAYRKRQIAAMKNVRDNSPIQ
jgi:hypothetical protein